MTEHATGWGHVHSDGSEIWDTDPIFVGTLSFLQKLKLLFYPKKLMLYRWMQKDMQKKGRPYRILDIGCGTGAALIEMRSLFGKDVELHGLDVVQMQIDIAKRKLSDLSVDAHVSLYDGQNIPFDNGFFDAVYSSDVLGHVKDVPHWLSEIDRVTKKDGVLAMFSESKLGKHAYIRNYLIEHGLNTDPHAEFHISLYSKSQLKELVEDSGFDVSDMWSIAFLKFFIHPDELYPALQSQRKFPFLRMVNKMLTFFKNKTRPVSLALCELYVFFEMLSFGRKFESQGYVIWAKKD